MNGAKIVEVGPRDGFQSIREFIPTELKLDIIGKLWDAGFKRMQITSFVSPRAIPQMQDAAEVARTALKRYPQARFFALVPNLRGAQGACEAGLSEVSTVLSLSESHNKANVGRSVEQSVEEVARILQELPQLRLSQDIATAFGCPFEGKMELGAMLRLLEKLLSLGVKEFTLCDTIGIACPTQVRETLAAVCREFPEAVFNVHIHDTRNMGMLNSYVALEAGAAAVQTALGGLGGCPFAPGASGNTATEDFAYMLERENIATGLDVDKLIEAARFMHERIDGNYSGHLLNVRADPCC